MYGYFVKYVPNIFHIAKYLNVSHDVRHILSYKRALYVTMALKWKNTNRQKPFTLHLMFS